MSYESICNFLLITYWYILPVACVKMRQIWAKLEIELSEIFLFDLLIYLMENIVNRPWSLNRV